jgi:hypothetical protein
VTYLGEFEIWQIDWKICYNIYKRIRNEIIIYLHFIIYV